MITDEMVESAQEAYNKRMNKYVSEAYKKNFSCKSAKEAGVSDFQDFIHESKKGIGIKGIS